MFHYLFTNDLRISNLESFLIEAAKCFRDNCVPSAAENKNANNNMNTLGFYFNLTQDSNCTKECVNRNVRKVVLNFIKKFQFPNPRTSTSLKDCIDDGIQLAPMRVILQTLYMMSMIYPNDAFLTKKEIADYIFFNEDVAKSGKPDISSLVKKIVESREHSSESKIPDDDKLEAKGCYWKQCRRQVREMVKVLCWSGCVAEEDNGNIKIHHDSLSRNNKADLFEVITFNGFWTPDTTKSIERNKESYQKYMDVETSNEEADKGSVEDIFNHSLFGMHIEEKNDALSPERPHVCIGWSKLGNLEGIVSKEELVDKYESVWPEKKPRSKGQEVGQIWLFYNKVNRGDYIIYANGDYCHIGRIESNYYFDCSEHPNQSKDYTNVRDVIWLRTNIKRSELSEALHRSLMTPRSIWTMNDYKSAVAELLKGTYVKDEVDKIQEVINPKEQKEKFKVWMSQQKKANGEPYSINTVSSYISQMERGYSEFDKYKDYESIFEIQDVASLNEYKEHLFTTDGFDEFNDKTGNKACSCGIMKYKEFLSENALISLTVVFRTGCKSEYLRNRIVFGAPGTGKSFSINQDAKSLLGNENEDDYERVTFHPDYSYANFVGTYKPVPTVDSSGKDAITYEYVPGPFMRIYVKALKNSRTDNIKPFLLIIEEINRANVAAVFGDIFQLLDRGDDFVSEYPIQATEDIKKYLAKELGGNPDDYNKIKIPDNMFIWATMNSADQGVFPMDTAFKRRWDFTYLGIDDNDQDLQGKYVYLADDKSQKVEWNKLRKAINNFLAKEKINEDKQLGPYFISRSIVVPNDSEEIDRDRFINTFKNKVIMYLFEDAAKQKRPRLFEGCFQNSSRYSEICREFEAKGIGIFNHDIQLDCEVEDVKSGEVPQE